MKAIMAGEKGAKWKRKTRWRKRKEGWMVGETEERKEGGKRYMRRRGKRENEKRDEK